MAFELPKYPTAFAGPAAGGRIKRPRQHAGDHLRFIRGLPSVIDGARPCEACHIRFAAPNLGKRLTGMAEKPDDRWSLPLTADQHRRQHSMNEIEFWRQHGIDPLTLALALWGATGDEETAEEIIRAGIASRPTLTPEQS